MIISYSLKFSIENMEITIKYQNSMVAKEFGQYNLKEVVVLPDTSKYADVLNLLKEKYRAAHPTVDEEALEKSFLNNFVVYCEKGIVRQIEDKSIDVKEVKVGTLIAGG
jgi:hypothetical protein